MVDIATNEPLKVQAGTTVEWKRTFADYPAPTWALKYSLVNSAGQITITATADGTDHKVSVAKGTTAGWADGSYHWQAYVDNGTSRHLVDEGTLEILPDFETKTTGFDNRSIAAQMVDALEALFAGKITRSDLDKITYSIGVRSMTKASLADLRAEYTHWKAILKSEQEAEQIANGLGTGRKIYTRFVRK